MFNIAVYGQFNRRTALERLQMLEQQTVVHRIRMVVVGFYTLFHRQMALIFVIAVFGNNADMFITHLFTQFAIKGTGNKTLAGSRCASNTDNDALMRLNSHKFSDLINLDVREGDAEASNAAIIGISAARYQSR
ncbi:hypothetical protein HMPREF0208_03893 [Citrobacter koseri]|nr:hypothetical protein HMPREF3220_02465 [Citrobacter koseri]KWZ99526.1 hypothetical protein HMPREF3207_03862 [Citrobacter koseri]KXB41011.1 hypothetical protein HMPREF0208_03893 [Citrobacter koseri]